MTTSQPAGKKNSSPAPVPAPSEASPVAAEEVQALLNSLAGSTAPEEGQPADPKLQSWFQGMLNFLPEEGSSGRRAENGRAASAGNPPAATPVPAAPRRGRMEAWELGGKLASSQSVNLEAVTPGSGVHDPGNQEATSADLERLISTAPPVPPPAPTRRAAVSSQVAPAIRSEGNSRGGMSPAHSPSATASQRDIDTSAPSAPDQDLRDAALRERVVQELQRVPSLAQIAVQVTARDGKVTLVGELSGDYERQLVGHFARQVRGVDEVVDLTRVRGGATVQVPTGPKTAASTRSTPRKSANSRRAGGASWSLPLRPAWIVGVAGLFVLAWAGLSFGKRDVDRIEVHPAQGRVQFGETIPEGALITLHPLSPSLSIRPRATVRADGTFQVSTYGASDGAPEGDYRVTIVWHKLVEVDGEPTAGPNLLPAPYSQPGTTELRVSVKPGSNELSPLQVRP